MRVNRLGQLALLLRHLRLEAGLTLRAVERLTGISNAYLSQLENGRTSNPSPHLLEKLSKALGGSYQELLDAAGYRLPTSVNPSKLEVSYLADELDSAEQREVVFFMKQLIAKRQKPSN